MNISDFKANVSRNPFLEASRYNVVITGPVGILSYDLSLYCSTCTLPGKGFSTVEQYHHGPIRKVPYSELYDDVTTNFYETEHLDVKEFFNNWHLRISDDSYYFAFYKDIIGTVKINIENKRGYKTTGITLIEAYPINVGEIELAYSEDGAIPVLPVQWAFHHWEKD